MSCMMRWRSSPTAALAFIAAQLLVVGRRSRSSLRYLVGQRGVWLAPPRQAAHEAVDQQRADHAEQRGGRESSTYGPSGLPEALRQQ